MSSSNQSNPSLPNLPAFGGKPCKDEESRKPDSNSNPYTILQPTYSSDNLGDNLLFESTQWDTDITKNTPGVLYTQEPSQNTTTMDMIPQEIKPENRILPRAIDRERTGFNLSLSSKSSLTFYSPASSVTTTTTRVDNSPLTTIEKYQNAGNQSSVFLSSQHLSTNLLPFQMSNRMTPDRNLESYVSKPETFNFIKDMYSSDSSISSDDHYSTSTWTSSTDMQRSGDETKTTNVSKRGRKTRLTDEERKDRRREQNKLAAQRCRQRKRDARHNIIKEYQKLESSNTNLRYKIRELEKKKTSLLKTIQDHRTTCILTPHGDTS